MTNFKLSDTKYKAFAHAIANGQDAYKAYIEHVSPTKHIKKTTAQVNSCKLMQRPEIAELIKEAEAERDFVASEANKIVIEQKIEKTIQSLGAEFFGLALTVEQLDQLHYSIVKGEVMVEEVVPVQTITKDERGKEVTRTTSFMRVKRSPNITERQRSIDALYKRFGKYAPTRGMFGIGKLGGEEEDGGENEERFLILSGGERVKLP